MIVQAHQGINPNLARKELALKRIALMLVASVFVLLSLRLAKADEPRTLDIYFLDMVGGASTLIVTPLGESVLIDTGSLRPEHRDADRILRACKEAGLKQIDYLVTTHFHSDHFGAILEVSQRIPVRCFIDKGARAPAGDGNDEQSKELYARYEQATKGNVKTIRAGDDIPVKNDPSGKLPPIRLHCVAAEKKVEGFNGDIDTPIEGVEMKAPDNTDNARSIALLLTCGQFKFFAGGDITWNVEHHLADSISALGPVDLYQVTHHGLDLSNNPCLLKALAPTVCVAMNGPHKGIQPRTFMDLETAVPGPRVLYQIHYNIDHDGQYNTIAKFIANPKDNPNMGEFIKVAVDAIKGIFTVRVGANGPQQRFDIQQPPPDLSQCTRIEIKWSRPVMETAYPLSEEGELLNAAESNYLESLRPTVLEDHKRIKALAESISRGRYRGVKGGIPRVHPFARVDCYRDGKLQESFTAYDPGLIILEGRWFDEAGFAGLWDLTPNEKTPELRPFVLRTDCAEKVLRLHWLFFDRQFHKEEYPSATQWCDAIVQDDLASGNGNTKEKAMARFRCPATHEGRCHYAMNPHCKWNSVAETVLLFETKAGWNQHGGPELLSVDNHDPKGGCVLFNDGKVKFVRTEEELRQLRWK